MSLEDFMNDDKFLEFSSIKYDLSINELKTYLAVLPTVQKVAILIEYIFNNIGPDIDFLRH
ncbi:MAG: hypothetical protein HUJ68_13055 [Clostridia bacterium]|nr:hypothetical protein [Clostridia bacterium]